jgi:hypothetical protein
MSHETSSAESGYQQVKRGVAADPGEFHGDRGDFASWWRSILLYLHANKEAVSSDDDKCIVVLSRLKGPIAGSYAESQIDKGLKDETFGLFKDLVVALEELFQQHQKSEIAERRLDTFMQGRAPVDDFLVMFHKLKEESGCDDQHAIHLLRRNASQKIVKTCYEVNTGGLPKSYSGWTSLIRDVGRSQELYQTDQQMPKPWTIASTSHSLPQHHFRDPNAMDVDRLFSVPSNHDRKGIFKCFNCGEAGHYAKECPKPKKKKWRKV